MSTSRRRFLQLLASSPVLPYLDLSSELRNALLAAGRGARQAPTTAAQDAELIKSAKEALDVLDFEPVARKTLPPAHWGYMAGGSDDDGTIRANREAFSHYQLRVRRLVDGGKTDLSVNILGARWETPILICPVGALNMFHADGELAVARAAKTRKHVQVLSTATTTSIEDVIAARGEPVWFQLYIRNEWFETRQIVKRAEAAGAPALLFTVDILGGRNLETATRFARLDTRQCTMCHVPGPGLDLRRRAMTNALTPPPTPNPEVGTPTWEYVKRLKDTTSMKIFLKGIVTREDAELAMQNGVDGLVVSNHGGRAENSLRPTIDCVAEVVAGVRGRAPVLVDGGFRRGTDIFKALALGANAVGIGRPYVWGLAAFGQEGVETVLDILRRELQLVMRQAGTPNVKAITSAYITPRL
jgi:isopentenyl diphosphate isomerase/L-lactate dehydrogenase-like FMN-dependent dehydrogenase